MENNIQVGDTLVLRTKRNKRQTPEGDFESVAFLPDGRVALWSYDDEKTIASNPASNRFVKVKVLQIFENYATIGFLDYFEPPKPKLQSNPYPLVTADLRRLTIEQSHELKPRYSPPTKNLLPTFTCRVRMLRNSHKAGGNIHIPANLADHYLPSNNKLVRITVELLE